MIRLSALLALCLFFGTTSSQAQLLRTISLKGGVAVSTQQWKFHDQAPADQAQAGKQIVTGPTGCVTMEWLNIADHLSLVTDLGYLQKGGRTYYGTESSQNSAYAYRVFDSNVEYLTAQALAKLRVNVGSVRFYGLAGPRIDKFVSVLKNHSSEPPVTNYEKTVNGLTYGGGVEVKVGDYGILGEYQRLLETAPALKMPFQQGLFPGATANNNAYSLQISVRYYFD